jgi:hypothetical protein
VADFQATAPILTSRIFRGYISLFHLWAKDDKKQTYAELHLSSLSALSSNSKSALFWGITQRLTVIFTDVLGQRVGPIFKGQRSPRRAQKSTDLVSIAAEAVNLKSVFFVQIRKSVSVCQNDLVPPVILVALDIWQLSLYDVFPLCPAHFIYFCHP